MSSDGDDYGFEACTDEYCTQENYQISIDNIQTKGNDVKETQQDTVYKKYSDDDSNGNEKNWLWQGCGGGNPPQQSFDRGDKRVKRNLPQKFVKTNFSKNIYI